MTSGATTRARYSHGKNGHHIGLQVHLLEQYLLGMSWGQRTFGDTTLPFGLRSAPLVFSAVADALAWIMAQQGVTWLAHYVDDFITVGAPGSLQCSDNACTAHAKTWACQWNPKKMKGQQSNDHHFPQSRARFSHSGNKIARGQVKTIPGNVSWMERAEGLQKERPNRPAHSREQGSKARKVLH